MSIEETATWKPLRGSIQKALLLSTVSHSCVVHMSLTERDMAPITFDYTSRELSSISPLLLQALCNWGSVPPHISLILVLSLYLSDG